MVKVQIGEAKRFIVDCLKIVGANVRPAREQAELLTYADAIGLQNHGLNKLEGYVSDIENGVCKPNNKQLILKEKSSTAWIDAQNVMGASAGCFAMNLAIKKANQTGVGWIAVKGTYGNAEPCYYWSQKAADMGLIGMVFSNMVSISAAAKEQELEEKSHEYEVIRLVKAQGRNAANKNRHVESVSRNPVCCAFLRYLMEQEDMLRQSEEEGPNGYNHHQGLKSTAPARRNKLSSQLAAMMDVFSGKSADNKAERNSNSWLAEPLSENLSHCFVVINPGCFAFGFDGKLTESIPRWKKLEPMDTKQLVVPLRNLESRLFFELSDEDTIDYHIEQLNYSIALAKKLQVKPMQFQEDKDTLQ